MKATLGHINRSTHKQESTHGMLKPCPCVSSDVPLNSKEEKSQAHLAGPERRGMSEPPSKGGVREAHLEALIRKALADAWAHGASRQEANRMAVQMVHEKFPKMSDSEISALIQTTRWKSG